MHEREPALARPLLRGLEALLERRAADVHDRALAARGLRLGDRRVGGDEDLAAHAARRGRRGEALGVVAGRGGDDAAAQPSSPSAASLADAPRTLNEPVRWRFSALSATVPPARSEIVRVESTGVRRATCSTSGRAAAIAAAVTVSVRDGKDRVDLDLGAERERGDADRGARRRRVAEERAVGGR